MENQFFAQIQNAFVRYVAEKSAADAEMLNNEEWFNRRCFDGGREEDGSVCGTGGFVYNIIANKHADAMDNYPDPVFLPREPEDTDAAEEVSAVLPVVLSRCGFLKVYSEAWWNKLKHGTAAYGAFWDSESEEICLQQIDLLNLFWEPHIEEIQDSRFLFITQVLSREQTAVLYPELSPKDYVSPIQLHCYEDRFDADRVLIVDCYYKDQGVQLLKFCGDQILYDSREDPRLLGRGLYHHGNYPVVLDRLIGKRGTPQGMGYIALSRGAQEYIDLLDNLLLKNALISGHQRWFIKDNGGVNEQEFLNFENDLIHVAGSLEESHIRPFQAAALPSYVQYLREHKIDELKEICGNRDFQQGGTAQGVTAYSAIVALQEAGNKLSRDMIAESYESYRELMRLCVALMIQFYDEERIFRITGDRFLTFSNRSLMRGGKEVDLDIEVRAQKQNPFTRESQNQLMLELYKLGVFQTENADAAKLLIAQMDFDGRDELLKTLSVTAQQNRNTRGNDAPLLTEV